MNKLRILVAISVITTPIFGQSQYTFQNTGSSSNQIKTAFYPNAYQFQPYPYYQVKYPLQYPYLTRLNIANDRQSAGNVNQLIYKPEVQIKKTQVPKKTRTTKRLFVPNMWG
uniref:CSON006652 protein n=1 Tax=Culicoides sonorensis TaxID=179676 RepID=A0A336LBS6_CULSO